jgi:hypothetical protein
MQPLTGPGTDELEAGGVEVATEVVDAGALETGLLEEAAALDEAGALEVGVVVTGVEPDGRNSTSTKYEELFQLAVGKPPPP